MKSGTVDKKVIIYVLSGAVLLVLDILFILGPLVNKTMDLRRQIISVKKNITGLECRLGSIEETKKRLAALKSEEAEFAGKFPKDEEIPSLLENISATAAKTGVDIVAIRPVKIAPQDKKDQKEEAESLFYEIPIEILAKGGYHQLGQFVNKLEVSARFMEVKDIDISRDPAAPRRHNLKLLVATYILRA